MSNNAKALKSGIWYMFSNFLVKSIGFLTTPIFTRILTKKEFGLYNNYTSWLSIMTILATMQLESTLISARYDYEKKFDEYILSILSLSTLVTGIWIVLFNFFGQTIASLMGLDMVYINAMMVYLLFIPAINLYQAKERYFFEYKKTVLTSLLLAFSTSGLSVLLVIFMDNKLSGRIFGTVFPVLFLGIVFYLYFIVKGKKVNTGYWKYALSICLPFIPHLLSLTALNATDRIMITRWCGSEANAMYSLAYTCGTMVTLLMSSLNSAFAPWLGEKLHEKKYKDIYDFSKIYINGFFYLAIGIMLISPELLWILGGKNYGEAKYVMTPVAMGCVCQFLYTMFVNIEQFEKKTMGMAIASMLAATINIGLNWLFIPHFGYMAAAYTTLVGYICLLVMHMFLVHKLHLSCIYDYRYIICTVVVGGACTLAITLLYSNTFLRYLVTAIYIIALFILTFNSRDKFLPILRRKK